MKYRVGDKVRIISQKPDGAGYKWNAEGKMDKWLGKIMTIRYVDDLYYKMEEDESEAYHFGWCWYDDMIAGLAEQKPDSKYKPGDKVIMRDDLKVDTAYGNDSFVSRMEHLLGKTVTISGVLGDTCYIIKESMFHITDQMIKGLAQKEDTQKEQRRVVYIDGKGRTTKATLYINGEPVRCETVKCSPDDTYSFEVGVDIAIDRLFDREERHIAQKQEKQEWYNGKVICVKVAPEHGGNFMKGRTYEIVDGYLQGIGTFRSQMRFHTFGHFQRATRSEFIEAAD